MAGMIDIEIDATGFLKLDGRLFRSNEPRNNGLAARLLRMAQFMQVLARRYGDLLGGDSRLVGQEKVELARQIDGLMIECLGLRCLLAQAESFSLPIPRTRHALQFTIDDDTIHGTGQLGTGIRLKPQRFSAWLDRMRQERLPSLLRNLGEAFADGVLTDDERTSLLHDVDLLFLGILLTRESLLRASME